jgi:hypothetical protein
VGASWRQARFRLADNVVAHALEVCVNGKIVRPWLGIRYVQIDEELKKKIAYDYGVLIIRGILLPISPLFPDLRRIKGLTENDIVLNSMVLN